MNARRRDGFALVVVLVVLVVVESAALLLAVANTRATALHLDTVRRLRLLALADSAADATLARLAVDPDAAGLEPTDFGGGTIASSVEWVDEHQRRITVEARLGDGERRVELVVDVAGGSPRVVAWKPLGVAPAI